MESAFRRAADDLHLLCLEGAFGDGEKLKQINRLTKDSTTNNFNDVKNFVLVRRYQLGGEEMFENLKKIVNILFSPERKRIEEGKIYEIISSFFGSDPKYNIYECMTGYCQCVKTNNDYFEKKDRIFNEGDNSKKAYSELGKSLINSYCDAYELGTKFIGCLNCFLDLRDGSKCDLEQNNKMTSAEKICEFKKKKTYPEIVKGFDNRLRNAHAHNNLTFDCTTLEFILKKRNGLISIISYHDMIKEKYNKVITFDIAFINAIKFMTICFIDKEKANQLIEIIDAE